MQQQSTRLCFAVFAGVALVAALSVPAHAHHGWAGNSDQETELTGTVEVPVSLAGPHATMKLNVNGKIWDVTLAPPARVQRAGLREGVIPAGATVTIVGHTNEADRLEMKSERVIWGDRVFDVYPNRH
jgi:hypothetical protein